jgi:hypothetical protein
VLDRVSGTLLEKFYRWPRLAREAALSFVAAEEQALAGPTPHAFWPSPRRSNSAVASNDRWRTNLRASRRCAPRSRSIWSDTANNWRRCVAPPEPRSSRSVTHDESFWQTKRQLIARDANSINLNAGNALAHADSASRPRHAVAPAHGRISF